MIERSLQQYGAGRSILVDKNGRIIAGNKTAEAAGSIGLEDAVMVESDGRQLVVVKRTDIDLDSPQGRALAIADNRTSQVGLEWDTENLAWIAESVNLSEFWFDDELESLGLPDVGELGLGDDDVNDIDQEESGGNPERLCPHCGLAL